MLVYIYMVLSVILGVSAMFSGAIYAGISGIIGPMLCWFAVSGLKGSLMVGTSSQKLWGAIAAIFFIAIGIGIVYDSGFWIKMYGISFRGVTWCLIGLVVGWISTTRQHAQ